MSRLDPSLEPNRSGTRRIEVITGTGGRRRWWLTGGRASGTRVVDVIAEPHGPENRVCIAGVLRDIISDRPYQIHLETPPNGTSCDIDAAGVESACAAVLNGLATSDLVVLASSANWKPSERG